VGYVTWRISSGQKAIAASQRDIVLEQRKVATAKLNLDLFDRRLRAVHGRWGFLSHGAVSDVTDYSDPKFTNLIRKARFLFGDEIADFMSEASSKKTQMAVRNKAKAGTPWAKPDRDKQLLEIGKW
jgi:hypothetical protein